MPTWVTPVVAAEIWNTTLDRVLSLIGLGDISTRQEGPFMLVDVQQTPRNLRPVAPPTWQSGDALSNEEISALLDRPRTSHPLEALSPEEATLEAAPLEAEPLEAAPLEFVEPDESGDPAEPAGTDLPDISQWRQVRRRVAKTRLPPQTVASC